MGVPLRLVSLAELYDALDDLQVGPDKFEDKAILGQVPRVADQCL